MYKKHWVKNWAYLYNLTVEKALFRGVWDLVVVPSTSGSGLEETHGYLEGRLCMHEGHGTSQLVAVNVLGPRQKRKNCQNVGFGVCAAAITIPLQLYACC